MTQAQEILEEIEKCRRNEEEQGVFRNVMEVETIINIIKKIQEI